MSPAADADVDTGPFVRRREFDALAPRYERGSRIMSLGQILRWRKKAVDALAPSDGRTYLDVGAGTGELTRAVLARAPNAHVIALDVSPAMMDAGRLTTTPRVRSRIADASRTGLDADSIDGAVTGFMLRHLAGPRPFLLEMRRVLRAHAPLVILEAHVPPPGLGRLLFRLYFYGVAWWLGALVTRSWGAHVGLYRSLHAFGGVDALLAAGRDAGFAVRGVQRGRFTGFFIVAFEKRPD